MMIGEHETRWKTYSRKSKQFTRESACVSVRVKICETSKRRQFVSWTMFSQRGGPRSKALEFIVVMDSRAAGPKEEIGRVTACSNYDIHAEGGRE